MVVYLRSVITRLPNHVRERLSGFAEGSEPLPVSLDARAFPEWAARAPFPNLRCACTGPVEWHDFGGVEQDIANLSAAVAEWDATDTFMTAVFTRHALRTSSPTTTTPIGRVLWRDPARVSPGQTYETNVAAERLAEVARSDGRTPGMSQPTSIVRRSSSNRRSSRRTRRTALDSDLGVPSPSSQLPCARSTVPPPRH